MEPTYYRAFSLYNNYQTSYVVCVSDLAYACLKQTLTQCMRPYEITMLQVTFYDEKFSTAWEGQEFLKAKLKAGKLLDKELNYAVRKLPNIQQEH